MMTFMKTATFIASKETSPGANPGFGEGQEDGVGRREKSSTVAFVVNYAFGGRSKVRRMFRGEWGKGKSLIVRSKSGVKAKGESVRRPGKGQIHGEGMDVLADEKDKAVPRVVNMALSSGDH